MTSSMRNFGASCDKRRPDVRFCGVEAAGEEGLGPTRGYQLSGWHAGQRVILHVNLIGPVGGIGYRMACRVPLNRRHGLTPWRGLRNSISFAPPWLTASLGKHRLLD
jgi:hypothetical protein